MKVIKGIFVGFIVVIDCLDDFLEKFSLIKMLWVVVWIVRFVGNVCLKRKERMMGFLMINEV